MSRYPASENPPPQYKTNALTLAVFACWLRHQTHTIRVPPLPSLPDCLAHVAVAAAAPKVASLKHNLAEAIKSGDTRAEEACRHFDVALAEEGQKAAARLSRRVCCTLSRLPAEYRGTVRCMPHQRVISNDRAGSR